MSYIITNALAILLATCAGLSIGLVYRTLQEQQAKSSSIALAITAIAAEAWLAAILAGALILAPPQGDPWIMAIGSAVIIWIGFVVPVVVVTHASRGLSVSAIFLDCTHWLVVMVVQAAVLHGFGLIHP